MKPDNSGSAPAKIQVDWRYQLNSTRPTRVIDLTVSEAGKIFALIEEGQGVGYHIILLDDRGKRLDSGGP